MAKRNVSEIETGAGFFMGLVNAMMDIAREKDVPFEAIYRLVTAGGRKTLSSMIDLAYTNWQAEQPKPVEQPEGGHPYRGGPTNGNSPFSAPIAYVQPEFEELKRRFPAYVNPDYKGKRFDPIERCKGVSKESRDVVFEYVYVSSYAASTRMFGEMDKRHLRPALYEELLGFSEKYPDEQRKYPIAALGSVLNVRGRRCVAYLTNSDRGRGLALHWFDRVWHGPYRFLAVRK